MTLLFTLLIAFQVKHFLCDFPLQTPYMLGKFRSGRQWISPLVTHALVHAGFTAVILLWIMPSLLWLAFVDFLFHFVIDRLKVLAGPRDASKPSFWWYLGADQMLHHLTQYFIIWRIFHGAPHLAF